MAFSEVCRICLIVNVRMLVLKKTGLQNLFKTLTNCFVDEDEMPIIVCFTCHARLIHCRRLQQQAIESNAVLEQLPAGGSMSIPKPHEARDEIQFTPIRHIDISPVECDIQNDCKDEILSLQSVKVEEENFENGNAYFEVNVNHETETAAKAEDLEIDTFGDRHMDSENDLPLIAFGSMSKEKYKTVKLKKEHKNSKKDDDDIEQYVTPTNYSSEPSEKIIKSNSTYSNINDVRKLNLDFESPSIKSNLKVKKVYKPINKKGNHHAKIKKTKVFNKKSVNILTKKISGASTKYSFECDGCSKQFLSKETLAKHILYSHKTQKNSDTTAVRTQFEQTPVPHLAEIFNCDICEFQTSQKRYILAHLKAHVAKQVYCCNNCDYKCSNRIHLQNHMKIHTGEKPFACNICEYKCIRRSDLRKHLKIHTGEKPFLCTICKFRCVRKNQLQNHLKIHTGEKPFSCYICEYRCIKKSDLQTHIKIHTGEKPFSCNFCEYESIQKSNLQRHMKMHTGDKRFSCYICEYKCITKSNLQRHMKIHTGEKPFSCKICDYKCITKSNLQTHMKVHTGEKTFSCDICKYRCITRGYLQTHMKIHTGEKPFSCNICEYKCILKSNLQKHMKIHTGEKPFSCHICDYKCIFKSNLQTHIKIHTGEKPFSCNICEYKCIIKRNLQKHMKIHTEKKLFFE